jgi:hypothetical protein
MMGYRKLLQQVTRRGLPPEIGHALLHADARDKSFFDTKTASRSCPQRMTTPNRTVNVVATTSTMRSFSTSRIVHTAIRGGSCSAWTSFRRVSTAR